VLQFKGVVKDYPGVRAVDHADLEIQPAEVHALVGENGAGKSTLIKILAGAVAPDAGEIRLHGQQVAIRSGSDAHRLGLSFTHQELNLVPYLSGAENIFLGRPYPTRAFGLIDWRGLYAAARRVLGRLGAMVPVDVPISKLTRGDQAMISIARAFAGRASIYVMDEPTASLTEREVGHLFTAIEALKGQGHTVIYVSHRLEEIFEIADRVTVMRDGKVVGTYDTEAITQSDLIRSMIGRRLSDTFPESETSPGEPLLRVEGLTGDRVRDITFTLHAGEVLGVAGLVGAGRTDVLRIIFGADPVRSGTMWLNGRRFQPRSPVDAIHRGVVLVPEERHAQGLVLNRSIIENITLPHLSALASGGLFLNRQRERDVSQQAGQAVHLRAASLQQPAAQLSGGNQQKVVFARWLVGAAASSSVSSPKLLLLDEPSRGVDVGARFEIYRIIRDLTARGIGILLVASDINELLGLSERVIVLREGTMAATSYASDLTREQVLSYCYGDEG
jgi:ribose transport system ATP-binding protein